MEALITFVVVVGLGSFAGYKIAGKLNNAAWYNTLAAKMF